MRRSGKNVTHRGRPTNSSAGRRNECPPKLSSSTVFAPSFYYIPSLHWSGAHSPRAVYSRSRLAPSHCLLLILSVRGCVTLSWLVFLFVSSFSSRSSPRVICSLLCKDASPSGYCVQLIRRGLSLAGDRRRDDEVGGLDERELQREGVYGEKSCAFFNHTPPAKTPADFDGRERLAGKGRLRKTRRR